MKPSSLNCLAPLALALALAGCGHEHDHDQADAGHGHSHGDDAESFSGATHKEGTGITLLEETRKVLGVETAEVREETLPRQIRFTATVFDMSTQGTVLATGAVSTNTAALLRLGLTVEFKTTSGLTLTGVIQQLTRPLVKGETEVVVRISEPERRSPTRHDSADLGQRGGPETGAPLVKPGDSGEIAISITGEKAALVVPRDAVIKGTTGHLVYAVNGDAYLLTWVQVGAEANGLIEITDGLLPGDSVVTRGAMDLWLVELRAVKGGQGCCPVPPKKGKS
jgi:hypothetical protein